MFLKAIATAITIFYSPSLFAQDNINSKEIELFTDNFFTSRQDKFGALGICIVRDTSILYQAAYGVTDFNKPDQNPASPATTVFGAASVSKLFTATALMQLVEQGKVNLDDDIRKYLPWLQIKFADNQKITIRQLLTHTAGIEDGMVGVNYHDARFPITMGTFFKEHKPKVVFTPGKQMSYSNRGMALAGLIVETISGIPFYQYVEKNIFFPLLMRHSSFRQPLPDTLKQKTLRYLPELDNDFLITYPSGSLFTTVADMGNFMLAHLNNGMFRGSAILKPSTVELMQNPQFTPQKGIPFMDMAFMEINYYGYKILYHTGARYYNTIFILIPDLKIGIYIALNGDGSVRKEYLKQFMKKYLPEKKLAQKHHTSVNLEPFTGLYRLNVGSRTTFEMLPLMVMQVKVRVKENQLTLDAIGFKPVSLSPVDTNIFIGDDGGYYVFELKNNKGFRLFRSNVPWDDPMTFTRISFYENGILHAILLLSSALILIAMFLIWSLKIMFGKFYFKNSNYFIRLTSILSYSSVAFFVLPILIVIGFTLTGDYATHVKSNLYLLFTFFNLSVALGIIVLSLLFYLLKFKIGSKSFKIQLLIVSFAFVILLCIGWYWNLIGYHFK
jgi:CubicO group peptidase (beta-lactamase class C family)